MAIIDIDTTHKVNIEAHYANSFELFLDVKNEDGTDYDFTLKLIVFTIYDQDKKPIKMATNLQSNEDFAGDYWYALPFYENTRLNVEPNSMELRLAKNFANLYDCNIEVFKFIPGEYKDFVHVLPTFLLDPENDANMRLGNMQSIRHLTGRSGFQINIPYYMMNISKGSYTYDIKVISDTVVKTNYLSQEVDSYWKNSSTWMSGKFTVI